MGIMKATTAHAKTIEAVEAKRMHMISMVDARIIGSVAAGNFECNFRVDSPIIQDYLFDYFTAQGYKVNFSELSPRDRQLAPADARIMNISWEDVE